MLKKAAENFLLLYSLKQASKGSVDLEDVVHPRVSSTLKQASKGIYGNMLLHLAIERGFLDIVQELIKNGADPNIQNDFGYTPLHLAVTKGDLSRVIYLIENGANVNGMDINGNIPLHIAATLDKTSNIIKYLLEHGANVNAKNYKDQTPLHISLLNNITQCDILIENGADINTEDKEGNTLLYFYVKLGDIEKVKSLISKGIAVDHKSLYFAYMYNHKICDIIIEHCKGVVIKTSDTREGFITKKILCEESFSPMIKYILFLKYNKIPYNICMNSEVYDIVELRDNISYFFKYYYYDYEESTKSFNKLEYNYRTLFNLDNSNVESLQVLAANSIPKEEKICTYLYDVLLRSTLKPIFLNNIQAPIKTFSVIEFYYIIVEIINTIINKISSTE